MRKLLETYDRSGNYPQLTRERLDSARERVDNYLRSPEFLNAMKQNIDVMITTKRQLNKLHRELVRQADSSPCGAVHELSEGLRAAGQSIRARLGEIEKKLATVDAKLIQITSSDFFESAQ